MTKIVIIFPPFFEITENIYKFYNGLETRTWRVAKELAKEHDVTVIATKGSELKDIMVRTGMHQPFNGRMPNPYEIEKDLVVSNMDIIKKADVILDDTHFHFVHYLKGSKPELFKNKILAFSWDHHPDNMPSLPGYPCNIVCVSKWQRNAIRRKFGMKKHSFFQAYSGLQLELYKDLVKKENTEENLYLYLSRFSTVKGAHYMIDLAKNYPEDEFVMLGDALFTQEPHYAQRLKNIADDMDNLSIIFNASWRDKIYYLNECTGLIHPGVWEEPFGLDMVEALYFGKPVLAFPKGGALEIINPHIGTFIMPNQDVEIERANIVKAFKIWKEKQFSQDDCTKRVEQYFDFTRLSMPVYKKALGLEEIK